MKRELKVEFLHALHGGVEASHTIPMKRELKVVVLHVTATVSPCFTHHPDEEGTESARRGVCGRSSHPLHTPSR